MLDLSDRDFEVLINALNYAKYEWAMIEDDAESERLAQDADDLEMRLKQERTICY